MDDRIEGINKIVDEKLSETLRSNRLPKKEPNADELAKAKEQHEERLKELETE